MAKLTLTDITAGFGSNTQLNANFDAIETAFENTLSRDGTAPNTMSADLDMNSNDVLNVNSLAATSITLGGQAITATAGTINPGSVGTTELANAAVTTTKLANNSVDGTKIALGSDAQGDVMYYNGTDWARLAAGTSGQFLKTQGAGANPVWDTVSTGTEPSDGDKGDITVSGSGLVWSIDNNVVTNAKMADVATATIKGRVTAGTGDVEDLTGTQATTLLDVFTSGLKGLAPASGGGTTNFLRADGAWADPASGGGFVFIETQDASASSQLDFTSLNSGQYDGYLFLIGKLKATGTYLLRTSTDGGSTFDSSTGNYVYSQTGWDFTTGAAIGTGVTSNKINLTPTLSGETWELSGQLFVPMPHIAADFTISGQLFVRNITNQSSNNRKAINIWATRDAEADVDAIRFFPVSSTFSSGTITLYGLRNSA